MRDEKEDIVPGNVATQLKMPAELRTARIIGQRTCAMGGGFALQRLMTEIRLQNSVSLQCSKARSTTRQPRTFHSMLAMSLTMASTNKVRIEESAYETMLCATKVP